MRVVWGAGRQSCETGSGVGGEMETGRDDVKGEGSEQNRLPLGSWLLLEHFSVVLRQQASST